jgi:regulatory protein
MAFARAKKKKEPLGESALFEYAVGALARKMRTVRDLKRLMRTRAEEGESRCSTERVELPERYAVCS